MNEPDIAKIEEEIRGPGYAVVDGLLTVEEIAALRSALLEVIDEDYEAWKDAPGKGKYYVPELVTYGSKMVSLLKNSKMLAIFRRLLGEDCILYSYSTAVMPAGEEIGASKIHVDDHFFIPNWYNRIVLTLALDEFTEANGATLHLPGSQSMAEKPSEEEFHAGAVRLTRPAGSGVFFDPRNWHAGGANTTDRIRCGLAVVACRKFVKPRFQYHEIAKKSLPEAELDSGLRRFLGFESWPPASVQDFYYSARNPSLARG
ncbi:MAG: phytanoyl-CoA dioxygenase family protein [Chthoniobacterales bacterium]